MEEARAREEGTGEEESEGESFTEADILFAVCVAARRNPETFGAKDVEALMLGGGYRETWEDAAIQCAIEDLEDDEERGPGGTEWEGGSDEHL